MKSNEVDEAEKEKHLKIKFKFDEIYTTKQTEEKLEFLPSMFSLLYVSLINYERCETQCNSPHIKQAWFKK